MANENANNTAKAPKKERTSIKDYFRGIMIEMKKVVWPTKQELGAYTAVVVAVCGFFALAFWAIDSGFLALLKAVLNIEL